MAEDKKAAGIGKDLSSKIATAYRNIPPEERQKTLQGSEDIQNPELDRAFEKMVETYRPKRGESAVVPFPRSASAAAAHDNEESPEGEGFECAECGHMNPGANKFCGMCGAEQEEAAETPSRQSTDEQSALTLSSDESKVRHHHHYYHHHHYRNNPYLLVAVMLLLGVVGWQEFRSYRQAQVAQPATPAVRTTVAAPQSPTPVEVKPAPPTMPAVTPKPASKPAAVTKAPAREVNPALPTRTPVGESVPVAPPESAFRKFMSSMFPSLVPPPTVVPNKPAASPVATPSASAAPKQ